ncbi:MAG: hypothetical protein P8Y64_02525 [Gammaproteobacteria bacterium]|jgi:hypothetical protein
MKRIDARQRALLVEEAARILVEEESGDFASAKRKAASRLGFPAGRNLPSNSEIEAAMMQRQRLFQGQAHEALQTRLRQAALRAMRLFDSFNPRLVGSVLKGTATPHSDVNLHLFSDSHEAVLISLMERGIPYQTGERRFRLGESQRSYPSVSITADGVRIEAVIFPYDGLRQAPLSPVDGRPMRRAARREVEALIGDVLTE